MNKYSLIILLLTLVSCSSSYTPNDRMLSFKKNMSVEQAVDVLQSAIWGADTPKGICGARGFWYDEQAKMTVFEDKISMLAHERGRQLTNTKYKGADDIVVFEKQYYKYDFDLTAVSQINIYDDPMMLSAFPECNKSNSNEQYLIIDLFSDKKNNLKFIVYTEHFDKTMAALSILLPNKNMFYK